MYIGNAVHNTATATLPHVMNMSFAPALAIQLLKKYEKPKNIKFFGHDCSDECLH
jgi:hypothetical protein